MKWTSIFALCAAAFFAGACEKHPLPGEEPVPERIAGSESKPAEEKKPGAPEPAQPAEDAKPGDSPKFFPEKK